MSLAVEETGILRGGGLLDHGYASIGFSQDGLFGLRLLGRELVLLEREGFDLGVFLVHALDIFGVGGHGIELTFDYNSKIAL